MFITCQHINYVNHIEIKCEEIGITLYITIERNLFTVVKIVQGQYKSPFFCVVFLLFFFLQSICIFLLSTFKLERCTLKSGEMLFSRSSILNYLPLIIVVQLKSSNLSQKLSICTNRTLWSCLADITPDQFPFANRAYSPHETFWGK